MTAQHITSSVIVTLPHDVYAKVYSDAVHQTNGSTSAMIANIVFWYYNQGGTDQNGDVQNAEAETSERSK